VTSDPTIPPDSATAPAIPAPPAKRIGPSGKPYTPRPRGRDVHGRTVQGPLLRGCVAPGCCAIAVWGVGLLIPIPTAATKAPEPLPEPVAGLEGAPVTPTPIPAVPTDPLGFACEAHREAIIDRAHPEAHPRWRRIARECRAGFGCDPDPKTVTVRYVKLA
jgi:hypothetical protein